MNRFVRCVRCASPVAFTLLVSACQTPTLPPSAGHITEPPRRAGAIPEPVRQSTVLSPPKAAARQETYSVTVHNVPAQSVLFALARDAGMNIDIRSGIEGAVTLNALNQTLPQLLERLSNQVDMRYEIDGRNLLVMPDTPVWRNYKIDYVNLSRSTTSSVNIATQISTTGGGGGLTGSGGAAPSGGAAAPGGAAGNPATGGNNNANNSTASTSGNNNSTTAVLNRSDNNFWASLERNIRDLLRESNLNDAVNDPLRAAQQSGAGQAGAPAGQAQLPMSGAPEFTNPALRTAAAREGTSVVVNVEAGLIAVRATGRQHKRIQEFMNLVMSSAKRQVLVEATIMEVTLSDQYQQGINWSRLNNGLGVSQGQVGSATLPSGVVPGTSPGVFLLNYLNPTSSIGNLSATVQLLESFGKVKVLSSPKISVMNNQTALLKVVDNNVFFTIKVTPALQGVNGNVTSPATYESQLETVPVGFVMSVTPQISDTDEVTLNVRPTITRIVGYVQDPNPALAANNVVSQVPVIQARELESVLKLNSGQIAVMGGLMQDSVNNAKDGIPGLSSLPVIGNFFSYRNEKSSKTELVIFMRPVVVKDASINGDYKDYRYLLPDQKPINSEPYFDTNSAPAKVNGS